MIEKIKRILLRQPIVHVEPIESIPPWFENPNPKRVPTEREIPLRMRNFFESIRGAELRDIGLLTNQLLDDYQLPGSRRDPVDYKITIFDQYTDTHTHPGANAGLLLSFKDQPIAVLGYSFINEEPVIEYFQGVKQSKKFVKSPIAKYLSTLDWRALLLDTGFGLATEAYEQARNHDAVYLVPARLQQWIGSKLAPENKPFDIKRAIKVIDEPASRSGFESGGPFGLWYKEIEKSKNQTTS